MEQRRIYEAAREILKGIEDVPVGRLTVGEALFLFRHCMRITQGGLNTIAAFTERDLQELITITQAILARTGPHMIH